MTTGGGPRALVEFGPGPMGCRTCGVIAHSHGRRDVTLVDVACFDRLAALVWRKRTWRCVEKAVLSRPSPSKTPTSQADERGLAIIRQDQILAILPVHLDVSTVLSGLERAMRSIGRLGIELTLGASTVHHGLAGVPEAFREASIARDALAGQPGIKALSALTLRAFPCSSPQFGRCLGHVSDEAVEERDRHRQLAACLVVILVDELLMELRVGVVATDALEQLMVHEPLDLRSLATLRRRAPGPRPDGSGVADVNNR